jgi:hypothetical protein
VLRSQFLNKWLLGSMIDEAMFYRILKKTLLCAFKVSCLGIVGFWDWIPVEADSRKTAFANIVQCARSSETSLYSER